MLEGGRVNYFIRLCLLKKVNHRKSGTETRGD